MTRLVSKWWWLIAVPMAALLLAGMSDWRWWVVALAIGCVLMPGVAMLSFYHYALSPDGVRAIMPQRAELTDAGLLLRYYPMDYQSETPKGWRPEPRVIRRGDVLSCAAMGEYTVIELAGGEVVEIPAAAQPKGMNLSEFFNHNAL